MIIAADRFVPAEGVEELALDWESLGQLVRSCTLQAVAMHFADTGLREFCSVAWSRGLKPASGPRDVIHE